MKFVLPIFLRIVSIYIDILVLIPFMCIRTLCKLYPKYVICVLYKIKMNFIHLQKIIVNFTLSPLIATFENVKLLSIYPNISIFWNKWPILDGVVIFRPQFLFLALIYCLVFSQSLHQFVFQIKDTLTAIIIYTRFPHPSILLPRIQNKKEMVSSRGMFPAILNLPFLYILLFYFFFFFCKGGGVVERTK